MAQAGFTNTAGNQSLTEMVMGYFRSRAVSAAARLELADHIGEKQRTAAQLASACGANPESLRRLLRALASFGVVKEIKAGTFALTPLGKKLRKNAPGSEWASVVFWGDLLADCWARLTECVERGEKSAEVAARESQQLRWAKEPRAHGIFRAVMGTAPASDYLPFAKAWNFSKYKVVADLGGGGGALIAAILKANPKLTGMLVDFQDAVDAAAPRIKKDGLAKRCKLVAADLREGVPAGADVYTMQHVLHGCTDEVAVGILRNCRKAVPAKGRLLVIEFVLPDAVKKVDAELEHRLMSDINMLAVTGGMERSGVQWKVLLEAGGFQMRRIIPVSSKLEARWGRPSIVEAAPTAAQDA